MHFAYIVYDYILFNILNAQKDNISKVLSNKKIEYTVK